MAGRECSIVATRNTGREPRSELGWRRVAAIHRQLTAAAPSSGAKCGPTIYSRRLPDRNRAIQKLRRSFADENPDGNSFFFPSPMLAASNTATTKVIR